MSLEDTDYKTVRDMILGYVEDEITDFLYYDRREDEDLELGMIEDAIESGEITTDEMANHWKKCLEKAIDECTEIDEDDEKGI